jgi:hypothetical protein
MRKIIFILGIMTFTVACSTQKKIDYKMYGAFGEPKGIESLPRTEVTFHQCQECEYIDFEEEYLFRGDQIIRGVIVNDTFRIIKDTIPYYVDGDKYYMVGY